MSDAPQMTIGSLMRMLRNMVTEDERFTVNSPVKFGVCDGSDLQMIDGVEMYPIFEVDKKTMTPHDAWVLLKAHHHPGSKPGELLRGAAADMEREIDGLLDGDSDREPPAPR